MNLDRFRDILDAYGAEPARWPEAERAAALSFAEADAAARAWLDEEVRFDRLLDAAPAAVPSAALAARIAAAAPEQRRSWRARLAEIWGDLFPGQPLWKPAAGLAFAALIGAALPSVTTSALDLETNDYTVAFDESAEPARTACSCRRSRPTI